MKIAVTGASGFIGRNLVPVLIRAGHSLKLLQHSAVPSQAEEEKIEVISGSIEDRDALSRLCSDVDVLIHLVGIIVETREKTFQRTVVEGSRNVVEACTGAGVSRIIYLSAIGADAEGNTEYFRSKAAAEEMIVESGLDYAILRPSLIYGRGDGFLSLQSKVLRLAPVSAIVGNGKYLMQPVFVDDLTEVVSKIVGKAEAVKRIIEVGGAERLEYRQIISLIKRQLGIRRLNFYVPIWLMKTVAWFLERLPIVPPFTVDQMKMLEQGSVADIEYMRSVLKVEPIGFEEGLKRCL